MRHRLCVFFCDVTLAPNACVSRVTLNSSSIVVAPSDLAFRKPSSNIVRIPFSCASRRYSGAPERDTIASIEIVG